MLFLVKQRVPARAQRAYEELAEIMTLSREQLALTITTADRRENAWQNLVRFARRRLVDTGLMVDADRAEHGYWSLTAEGRDRATNRQKLRDGTLKASDLGF